MPNRLVYRTILETYYRNEPHPLYRQLEGHGYTYLGSIIQSQEKYDLYVYRCAGEELLLGAWYGEGKSGFVLGSLAASFSFLQEARRRAEASGLLDPALFYISYQVDHSSWSPW